MPSTSSRICIKNLGKNTTEEHIRSTFSSKGEVTDVRLVKTNNGQSRGFAFVGFRSADQAKVAMKYFDKTFLDTSKINIEMAVPINDASLTSSPTNPKSSRHKKKKMERDSTGKLVPIQVKVAAPVIYTNNQQGKIVAKPMNKSKQDFVVAMKNRKDAQFWGNDESVSHINTETDEKTKHNDDTFDESDGSDSDEDMNDFTGAAHQTSDSDDDQEDDRAASEEEETTTGDRANSAAFSNLSDMDFLRSKIVKPEVDSNTVTIETTETGGQSNKPTKATKAGTTATGKGAAVESSGDSKVGDADGDVCENADGVNTTADTTTDELDDSGRLFIRNLPYSCTEDEVKDLFAGVCGHSQDTSQDNDKHNNNIITEIHMPLDENNRNKGYGYIQFIFPEQAAQALKALDGSFFQGRVLHILTSKKKREDPTPAVSTG